VPNDSCDVVKDVPLQFGHGVTLSEEEVLDEIDPRE
jgi:hypothetical protein